MRIALVSFEYPPDTAFGGIATYNYHWAQLLKKRGHHVDVFCASHTREGFFVEDGINIHLILTDDRNLFKSLVYPVFIKQHEDSPFDIVESAEFNTDASIIKKEIPSINLVVKLHTPTFLVDSLNNRRPYISVLKKLKIYAAAIKHLTRPNLYWKEWAKVDETEKSFTLQASLILSPSKKLGEIVSQKWDIPAGEIRHLPNPYIPNPSLLDIPIVTSCNCITYIGRLEVLKGVLSFTDVIPAVLKKYPSWKFRFIGRSGYLDNGTSIKEHIASQLADYQKSIEFIDGLPLSEIPLKLSQTDICVFPSLWDNFPNVCLEAMSAGRAIVGGNNGGMPDMLENPQAGLLIDPSNSLEIINAICKLIESPELRQQIGTQARNSVLEKYNTTVLGETFENMVEPFIK